MGDEREFKIKITGDAGSLVGSAQQGSSALGEVTKVTEKSAGASDAAGAATERHSMHLHGLHKICHALNGVVPGLGVAMQAAFSPIGAAISLAVMALHMFREKMKEVNEELKRMEEEAAKPLTHRMEAMRESVVRNATGMAELRDRLEQAARGEQTLKEQTEKAIAASRQQAGQAQSLAEATKENELARLELMHGAGLMSEQKYADGKLAIELEYRQKKQQLEEREEMTEILMRKRRLEDAQSNQPELVKAAEAAEAKKEKALENLAALRSRSEIDEDKKKTGAALKEFEEKHQKQAEIFGRIGAGATDEQAEAALKANRYVQIEVGVGRAMEQYKQWAPLKIAAEAAEKEWKQAPGAEARKKVEADAATREAERAARRAEQNQAFITDTGRDLGERRSTFDERQRANAQRNALEADTLKKRELIGSPSGKLISEVAGAEHVLQSGGRISAAQQSQILVLKQMLDGHHENTQQVLQMLGKVVGNTDRFTREVAALSKRLDGMKLQQRNTFNQ